MKVAELSDLNATDESVDRVVDNVMSQLTSTPQLARDLMLELTKDLLQTFAVAAALLIVGALWASSSAPRQQSATAPMEIAVTSWLTTSHVPTNGELLTAFQGYRP